MAKIIVLICTIFLTLSSISGKAIERRENPDERGVGDMRFKKLRPLNGLLNPDARWKNGWIYYEIGSNWSKDEKKVIYSAMDHISEKTCIRFMKRGNQRDYVTILKDVEGCWSYVGRVGGVQELGLGEGCLDQGTIVHELMHAIGFQHEQQRTDRDNFVRIIGQNIKPDQIHNFEKFGSNFITPFNVSYDYDSIMHYSPYAFSKNGRPTVVPTKTRLERIGQRSVLSKGDITKIKRMYNNCKWIPRDENSEEDLYQDEDQNEVGYGIKSPKPDPEPEPEEPDSNSKSYEEE